MTTYVTLLSNVGTPNNTSNTSYSLTYSVGNIAVANGGANYNYTPRVIISGGSGSGATASAVVDSESETVTGFIVDNGGSGYSNNDVLTIDIRGNGSVGTVNIANGGSGYGPIPTIQFSSPANGITATGEVTLANNSISSVKILNTGTGYTTPPTVSVIPARFNYPVFAANLQAELNTGTGAQAGNVEFVPQLVGYPAQGSGYYLRTVSSQNIHWSGANGNVGNIVIQGALTDTPSEGDWVTAATIEIGSNASNVNGNASGARSVDGKFTTIRAQIQNWGGGTIGSVWASY